MRLIRSFFGGLAMLAAAIVISMPATAMDRDPGLYAPPMETMTAFYQAPALDMIAPEVLDDRSRHDAHRAIYIRQNQPVSTWRVAVDAYSRIDPHIRLG